MVIEAESGSFAASILHTQPINYTELSKTFDHKEMYKPFITPSINWNTLEHSKIFPISVICVIHTGELEKTVFYYLLRDVISIYTYLANGE